MRGKGGEEREREREREDHVWSPMRRFQ